ncbi:F-box only protein 36 isoform X1 [Sciurus carolinensis]|uniref:F-box only protein 36 isoform X1 n=1 Tax=Sciurus carolinensis TaxID=30640 RepID=UPI001FB49465|nr:F-box only protein 36 isoform X1 [Sciurus carolinensis]
MASWLPETLFEIVGQGPAPSKDYYQLLVTRSQDWGLNLGLQNCKCSITGLHPQAFLKILVFRQGLAELPWLVSSLLSCCLSLWSSWNWVIFRWWKISLRSEYRSSKPGEIKETHEDFLENSHLQVQIALIFGARILDYVFNLCEGKFDFLERLSDGLLLSIISYLDLEDVARLSQTCRRFAKLCTSDMLWEQIVRSSCDTITSEMRALAQDIGWRQMFFTNKFQLQRQLRKRKQIQDSRREKKLL